MTPFRLKDHWKPFMVAFAVSLGAGLLIFKLFKPF